jgi:hypothetical protein
MFKWGKERSNAVAKVRTWGERIRERKKEFVEPEAIFGILKRNVRDVLRSGISFAIPYLLPLDTHKVPTFRKNLGDFLEMGCVRVRIGLLTNQRGWIEYVRWNKGSTSFKIIFVLLKWWTSVIAAVQLFSQNGSREAVCEEMASIDLATHRILKADNPCENGQLEFPVPIPYLSCSFELEQLVGTREEPGTPDGIVSSSELLANSDYDGRWTWDNRWSLCQLDATNRWFG